MDRGMDFRDVGVLTLPLTSQACQATAVSLEGTGFLAVDGEWSPWEIEDR